MVEYNPRSIDQMYEQYGRVQSSRAAKFNKSPLDDNTSSGFGGMGPDPEAKAKGLGSPTNQTSKKDDDDDKEVGGIGRLFSKFFGAAESAGLEFKKLDRPKPSIYDRDDMKPIDIDAMDKRIDDAVNFDLANPLPSMNFKDDEYAASTYDEVQPLEGADTYKARRTTAQGINDTIKGLMDTEQRQTDIRQAVNKTIDSLRSADANVPYVIQAGDTLSDIAAKTGTTVQDLVKTNNIKDKNKIYTGNELIVPTDKTTKTKEEIVNNLVKDSSLRITTRGDEDPDSEFYNSFRQGIMTKENFDKALVDRIVELEGYIPEAKMAFKTDEFPTIGYGQSDSTVKLGQKSTQKQAEKNLKEKLIPEKIETAKRLFTNFDGLSDELKIELVQGVFRGDFEADQKVVKLINEEKWDEASVEMLDHNEYEKAKRLGEESDRPGIVPRLEAISKAIQKEQYK